MKRTGLLIGASLWLSSFAVQALEPLDDDNLAATSGQSGLTLTLSPVQASVSHLRYSDGDGFAAGGYTNRGTLDFSNLQFTTTGNTVIKLDVASTGVAATPSALFMDIGPMTGASLSTDAMSVDNGSLLTAGSSISTFGKFSLSNINTSAIRLRVAPGGQFGSEGISIRLAPLSMAASSSFQDMVNGGVIKSGVTLTNFSSSATVDVTSSGLMVGLGATTADLLQFSNIRVGADLPSTEIGTIGVSNFNLSASTMRIVPH